VLTPRYAAGNGARSVAICDLDGANGLDLAVANGSTHDVSLLLNQGDGTFATPSAYPAGDYPVSVAVGDLDGANGADLAAANYESGAVSVLLNHGDGTFPAAAPYPVGDTPRSVAIGDLDGANGPDLAVAGYDHMAETGDVRVLLNQGDGTFQKINNSILTVEKSYTGSGAWADIDVDGDLDLFVTGIGIENALYINNTEPQNWLSLECVGMISNRSAIGAHVFAKADIAGKTTWQMRECSAHTGRGSQNDLRIHFGLGDATQVDSLVISWPSGITDIYTDIAVNRRLTIIEGQGVVPVELALFAAENSSLGNRRILTTLTSITDSNRS